MTSKNVRSRNFEIATKLSKRNCIDLLTELSDTVLGGPEAKAPATDGLNAAASAKSSTDPTVMNTGFTEDQQEPEYGLVSFSYIFRENSPKHRVKYNPTADGGSGKFEFDECRSERFNAKLEMKKKQSNYVESDHNFVSQYHHPLFRIENFDQFIIRGYLCKRWIEQIVRWARTEKNSSEAQRGEASHQGKMKKHKPSNKESDEPPPMLCDACRSEDLSLKDTNDTYDFEPRMYAFSQVSFVGFEGMPSFIIHCDQSSTVNRKEHIDQRAFVPAFGYLFVSWDGKINHLVKVICILRFVENKRDLFAKSDSSEEKRSGHNILIVATLRELPYNQHSPRGPFPYPLYEYEIGGRGVTNHAIEFSKVVAPACVVPYYTKQFTPQNLITSPYSKDENKFFYLVSSFPETSAPGECDKSGGGAATDDGEKPSMGDSIRAAEDEKNVECGDHICAQAETNVRGNAQDLLRDYDKDDESGDEDEELQIGDEDEEIGDEDEEIGDEFI
jgi:hypothetical protein